jgi:Skp family chaperone for outer membrane proteins
MRSTRWRRLPAACWSAGALLAAAVCLLALGSTPASTPTPFCPRVGIVDTKAIMTRSQTVQATVGEAEQALSQRREEIDRQMAAHERERQDLEQRRAVLSDEQIQEREQKIRQLDEQIQDLQYEANKELGRLSRELMSPQSDRIVGAIEHVARVEGYDLVLPTEIVLFQNGRADLTPLVIEWLDRPAESEAVEDPSTGSNP